jgi:hypothetical protein
LAFVALLAFCWVSARKTTNSDGSALFVIVAVKEDGNDDALALSDDKEEPMCVEAMEDKRSEEAEEAKEVPVGRGDVPPLSC